MSQIHSSRKADLLRKAGRKGWTPPPLISVDKWADTYRYLAREAGSTSGRWQTEAVEVARGPMRAVTEPGTHTITLQSCTQLLKTSLIENAFGYFAHLDPCPILLTQPKEEAALQFSKERIGPLVRATPVLREIVGSAKTRNAEETLLYKAFPGGFLALAGAGSPDNLARRPIRLYLGDEINKYPVTKEGDPILLAEERLATFGLNWLSIRACSPTDDEGRITTSYLSSDQRRASVACPHCGHRQFLDFFKHVDWKKEDGQHFPKTARIHCELCSAIWSEGERLRALKTTRWHQTRPFSCCGKHHVPLDDYERAWRDGGIQDALPMLWDWWSSDRWAVYRARCTECGKWTVDNEHAGFQASKLFSPWQRDKPSDIAKKWLDSQGDEDRKQAWWNTQMGLPYRSHAGKELKLEALIARCELWAGEIPLGVAVVTGGIDVQDDRIEIELVGWGHNEESWSIDYEIFEGDPGTPEPWEQLEKYLLRTRYRADGRPFEIMAACIDSGGHHTQKVYEYAKARIGRRIWAIKGESARGGQRSPVWPAKKNLRRNKSAYRPIILGVNAAKDTVRSRLHVNEPGSGYMHFPSDRDLNYFAQLTAERLVTKEVGGQRIRVWELPAGKANEAADCRVYAYGALCGLLHHGLKLNKRADDVSVPFNSPQPRELVEETDVSDLIPEPATRPIPPKPEKKTLISRLA